MIGDWMLHVPSGRYVKVEGVYGNAIYTTINYPTVVDDVLPIPLTKEIFEKNGFHYEYCSWSINADDECLGVSEIEVHLDESYDGEGYFWVYCGVLIKKVRFVHELQHILEILGVEKKIEL